MYNSVVGFALFMLVFNMNAEIISIDWQIPGDNLVTRDTGSGLDWLDLTETNYISRQNILPQLQAGGCSRAGDIQTTLKWPLSGQTLVLISVSPE